MPNDVGATLVFRRHGRATCMECSFETLTNARDAAESLRDMPMVQPLRQQQVASLAASFLHDDFRFSRSVPASSPLSAPAPRSVIGRRAIVPGITRAVTKGWKNDDRPTSCCCATEFYLLWTP